MSRFTQGINLNAGAGRLRDRIRIDVPVRVRDSSTAGWVNQWQTVHPIVPADIQPLSVRDFIESGARQAEVTARIKMRYVPGINATMRAVNLLTGEVYEIIAPLADPDSGREYITLAVKEGVNDG